MPDQPTIAERIAKREDQIDQLKGEWHAIPDFIDVRLRLTGSRVARLSSEMADVKERLSSVEGKVDALPRVLAEMLDERDGRRR